MLVTLSRPKALNAIPVAQHLALSDLWTWYDQEPWLRCAVLTGTGRAFCAGADLKEWDVKNNSGDGSSSSTMTDGSTDIDADPNAWLFRGGFGGLSNRSGPYNVSGSMSSGSNSGKPLPTGSFSNKKPIVAAVNGLCLGGGMEMAVNCDIIVASASKAKFALPEVKRGVIALAGALPRLVRTVGRQRASEMALLGRMYGAREMKDWGIVNKVVEDEKEHEGEEATVKEALKWAEEIAGNSPDAVVASKEGLRLGWEGLGPEDATEVLLKGVYMRMDGKENMKEGVRAFVEKRGPKWVGSKL